MQESVPFLHTQDCTVMKTIGGGGEEGDWGLGTHVLWGRSGGRHFNVHSLMQSPDKLNSAVAFRQF